MISSNLIKSNDESVIEIRKFDILRKMTQRKIHGIKITEFGFDFVEKSSNEQR